MHKLIGIIQKNITKTKGIKSQPKDFGTKVWPAHANAYRVQNYTFRHKECVRRWLMVQTLHLNKALS